MVLFNIIAAYANDYICGVDGKLPWKCEEDIESFKNITTSVSKKDCEYDMKNAVVMGYNTFCSIGKYLPNRYNFVIDKNGIEYGDYVFDENVYYYHIASLGDVLKIMHNEYRLSLFIERVFIIGGEKIYEEFFDKYMYDYFIEKMYITKINKKIEVMEGSKVSYFPFKKAFQKTVKRNNVTETNSCAYIFNDCWELDSVYVSSETKNEYRIYNGLDVLGYDYVNNEREYLQLMYNVIEDGVECNDRTGVGTVSKFGAQIRFSLRNNTIPLLTTKKMFHRGIVEELLWFLRGETDSKILEEKNVNIWKGNTSRMALDGLGLKEYAEGEGGPIYGHQFRNFGAQWEIDSNGKRVVMKEGIDQVENVIEMLKNNRDSRRIMLSLWNPVDLDKMALPPCHVLYQFRVYNGRISCSMYQRSCDTFLGLPFNICSTALMTMIFGRLSGLEPDEIIISIGDAHIYKNHIEQVKSQLKRTPYSFPKINIKKRNQKMVEDFRVEDFEIVGYESHSAIKGEMAV